MAPSTVGVTYTIALDSTFLVAVCLYHLLLVLLHVYLAKSAKSEQDQNSQPAKCSPQSESESDEADLVTCRAPTLYVCQSKAAECAAFAHPQLLPRECAELQVQVRDK